MFTLLPLQKAIHIEGIYTFFYQEHGRDFKCFGERHDFWEMVYVDSGELSAMAGNTACILSQGDVIFHKPMEFHNMASACDKPHNVVIVTFETKSPAMSFFENKILTVNAQQKKILSAMLKEWMGLFDGFYHNPGGPCTVLDYGQQLAFQVGMQHLEHFFLELIRRNAAVDRSARADATAKKWIESALVQNIKEYLGSHVNEPVTLDDICGMYHMSRSYICRLFKNEVGCGVIDHHIDLKIKQAKLLIRSDELNLTQIAEKLGYASLQHFSRIFKTKTQMSPSEYAKSIR